MIKISDSVYVAAEHVQAVEINIEKVFVVMKDGTRYPIPNDWGKGAYQTADRLAKVIHDEANIGKVPDYLTR